jgi:hypothetical protein
MDQYAVTTSKILLSRESDPQIATALVRPDLARGDANVRVVVITVGWVVTRVFVRQRDRPLGGEDASGREERQQTPRFHGLRY